MTSSLNSDGRPNFLLEVIMKMTYLLYIVILILRTETFVQNAFVQKELFFGIDVLFIYRCSPQLSLVGTISKVHAIFISMLAPARAKREHALALKQLLYNRHHDTMTSEDKPHQRYAKSGNVEHNRTTTHHHSSASP